MEFHIKHKACVDEFLCDLPEGLDTLLTKQNMPLSQGQLQRISIARALYSQTKILLLDEATSGLDEALEAKILNNLKDKTIIIISHRPSIRKLCNQFYELKEA